MTKQVHIVGAGLAGSECALQLAKRGVSVVLYEQRPASTTPAHKTNYFAELVCSNSLKSQKEETAAGTLKKELEILDSELLKIAKESSVPAGNALAVDRDLFAKRVTAAIKENPLIEVVEKEVTSLSEIDAQMRAIDEAQTLKSGETTDISRPQIILATGPLTTKALLENLNPLLANPENVTKRDSEEGKVEKNASESGKIQAAADELLHFYDAAAPIVEAGSLDRQVIFEQSRYDFEKDNISDGDYLNAPMTKEEYERFVAALLDAGTTIKKDFEATELFQACQPIEEVARTGMDSLRFGALKPVGLIDPRTGKRPYAAVQLRAENAYKQAFNLVGFQTNLTWSEQKRIFSMIPGLENAHFLRFGVMHKNAYLDSPRVLDETFAFPAEKNADEKSHIRFAGQITGTEGYTEAIASGLFAALNTYADLQEREPFKLPQESVLGALFHYATNPHTKNYQPMHVNFGLMPPLSPYIKNRRERYAAFSARAQENIKKVKETRQDLFNFDKDT